MRILRGYVVGAGRGVVRVRHGGGTTNVLTKRPYRYGDNLVLLYDPLRDLVVESYTASEWDAQQKIDLDDPGMEEEVDNDEDFAFMDDLDV